MTSAPAETPEDLQPVRIISGDPTRDTTNDRFAFYLGDTDDTVLIGVRPKVAVLIDLVQVLGNDEDQMQQLAAFQEFIDLVLSPETAAHLRARMRDPEDDLDLDHPLIAQMFKTLVAVWYGGTGRPTGGRPGSSGSPRRTGQRSTARSRSRG